MKRILLAASALIFSVALMAQQKIDDIIKMNTEKHDFGKIKQNVPAFYYFEITNLSDKPVVVENVTASCGCTTPEKPTEPILPGKTAKLKVQYSAAALAAFQKDVTIKLAGVDQTKVVRISGEVLEPTAFDAYVKEKGKEKDKPSKSGGR
ncbi:MAG: DUF1573 domain-containing protein [Bacteroidota bacterium]|nr:DUF1573 domain-containing protein [Bacteroidota bacterium]